MHSIVAATIALDFMLPPCCCGQALARPAATLGGRGRRRAAVRRDGSVPNAQKAPGAGGLLRKRCGDLPVRREFLQQDDLLRLDGDVAAGSEVLEDAAHHLARAADARGDVVLRQALGYGTAPARLDGVFL